MVAIVSCANRSSAFRYRGFAQGARAVIVCSRSTASAEKSVSMIQAYPEGLYATNPANLPEFALHLAERHKRGDILINNVGYDFDPNVCNERFHKAAEEDFQRIFYVYLGGTYMVLQAAIAPSTACEDFTSATYNIIAKHGGKGLP